MNIYDEAKVITHEEARNKVKSNHNKFYTEGEFTKDMLDYINQQEKKDGRAKKVEGLLELYREKDKLRDELFNEYTSIYSTAQSLNKIVNDFKQIQEQINILEKELEEMK